MRSWEPNRVNIEESEYGRAGDSPRFDAFSAA